MNYWLIDGIITEFKPGHSNIWMVGETNEHIISYINLLLDIAWDFNKQTVKIINLGQMQGW